MAAAERTFPFLPGEIQRLVLVSYRRWKRSKKQPKKARLVGGAQITRDLIRLGVKPCDTLFVHSSMSSLGRVPGGPEEVIDAIIEAMTANGTLVMPAFSQPYGSMLGTLKKGEIFDPETTPSTVGLIPETFRLRAGVRRSVHPTSSVCAFGAKADLITKGACRCDSDFGVGTPFYKIVEYGGKILGLGVDLGPVSLYHLIEDVLGEHFPKKVRMAKVYNARVIQNGKKFVMRIRPLDPWIARTRIERNEWLRRLFTEFLIDRGVLRFGNVGQARSWLIGAKELFDAQRDLLKRGITIYTTKSEYDATRQRLVSFVTDYRSNHSNARHNYLEEQVSHIRRNHEMKGFWDSKSCNWIRQLNWTGSDWNGFVPHDWKYAMELQEGATQYALITGSRALDCYVKGELEYIHSNVRGDGRIAGIPDRHAPEEYEYGSALSAMALGYRYFMKKDPTLADSILNDLNLVHGFMTAEFKPTFDDPFSIVLRAYANLLSAYQLLNGMNLGRTKIVREQIAEYAQEFIRHQGRSGLFQFRSEYGVETSVHMQLKVDIALLRSYELTMEDNYLISAAKNLDWVTSHLLMPNGALKWDIEDENNFFEIHQMLLLIAYRYLDNLSRHRYDCTHNAISAWKFLLDGNAGCTDMYLENVRSTRAFFSFRHIDSEGNFQKGPYSSFKGSYEVGYSLWALALNRDLSL
jgi:aminoglycoside 3-N-acetyltransferase